LARKKAELCFNPSPTRRECLKGLAGTSLFVPALPAIVRGETQSPLPPFPDLAETEALLLTPKNKSFGNYQGAFNSRTVLRPRLRALCKTPGAVAVMIEWLRAHRLPFAVRSGGHCFEGFSQSDSVVLDTRLMNRIDLDAATGTIATGPGALLGKVYKAAAKLGLAVSAGNCPAVGVAGHALGGGSGYLSRQFGFLCDTLRSVEYVNANGKSVVADDDHNEDLYWASRGGGGGALGVATRFRFRGFPLRDVLVFKQTWSLLPDQAVTLVKFWQECAFQAPEPITSTLTMGADPNEHVWLECAGQSVGSEDELRRELRTFPKFARAHGAPEIKPMSFLAAANYLSEDEHSIYAKGKSDVLASPLSGEGIGVLIKGIQEMPAADFAAVLYAYGGAIGRVAPAATAFPYRNYFGCLQYDLSWSDPADTPTRLMQLRRLYQSMRPYVSGRAYVNYCDVDLQDWRHAYWGPNLPRLESIKARVDPDNFFHHGQSF
jgi:FAD/FMN-containing dehydrogenase